MRLIDADKLKVYRCDDSASRATFDYIYEDDVEDAPTIDLVRCGECKYYNGHEEYCEIDHFARENGYCSDGKKRTDYTVFTVNPPKGIETPLRGDATVLHKNSKMTQMKGE